MKAIKLVLFMIALTMVALTISLVTPKTGTGSGSHQHHDPNQARPLPAKRKSRFLQAAVKDPRAGNPNAADHCRKDNDVCQLAMPLDDGRNATCCNNKCVDLDYDAHNCGACKKKCFPFQSCCRGECVDLNYDKRHCGRCNNSCKKLGNICFYGTCGYA